MIDAQRAPDGQSTIGVIGELTMSSPSLPASPAIRICQSLPIERTPSWYRIIGAAFVFAAGHRTPRAAHDSLERIATDPASDF